MNFNLRIVCFCLLLAACSPAAENPEGAVSLSASTAVADAGKSPSNSPAPSVTDRAAHISGHSAASWDEFVALQAIPDQEYLQSLEKRYFGAVAFQTADEREYMNRAGFPSPEEWLAAKRMTDSQLQEKADAGDPKAAGMFADRMSVQLGELLELAREDPDAVTDADRARLATLAVAYSSRAMDASKSPFGLYVEGAVLSSIFNSWEPMTAALLESMERGDPRVDRLMGQLHARHPNQDIEAILISLRRMKQQYP